MLTPLVVRFVVDKLYNKSTTNGTRNCKHRRASAKSAACANSLDLSQWSIAYRFNVIWIGALCRRYKAKTPKYHNFDQIFTLWGALVLILLYRSGPILRETVDPRSILIHQFNLNSFIVSPSSDEKPQFWANVNMWGHLYPAPLPIKPNLVC